MDSNLTLVVFSTNPLRFYTSVCRLYAYLRRTFTSERGVFGQNSIITEFSILHGMFGLYLVTN